MFSRDVIAAMLDHKRRFSRDVIAAMLVDENKRSLIGFFCSSTKSHTFLYCYWCHYSLVTKCFHVTSSPPCWTIKGGFHVTSSPPCWWMKTKDLLLGSFVRPPKVIPFCIVIGVTTVWLETSWPGLLEAWLALTSIKYHGNLWVLIPLNQRLALTMLRATGPCTVKFP